MKMAPIRFAIAVASAIAAAMVSSKSRVALSARWPVDGVEIDSSLGGQPDGSTVTAQVGGDRSWTETGPSYIADDYLSATSKDDAGTITNQVWWDGSFHDATAVGTTATEKEWY